MLTEIRRFVSNIVEEHDIEILTYFGIERPMKPIRKISWLLGLAFVALLVAANGQAPSDVDQGKKLVDKMCASCHTPGGWMHSKEDWEFIVPDMAAKGGEPPGENEAKLMVAYLARKFGMDQEASGTQASSEDEKGKKLLERTCLSCHESGGWMHTKGEWEGIAPDHASRGGLTLTEEEMKLLVAYLTRHFGPLK